MTLLVIVVFHFALHVSPPQFAPYLSLWIANSEMSGTLMALGSVALHLPLHVALPHKIKDIMQKLAQKTGKIYSTSFLNDISTHDVNFCSKEKKC